MTVKRMRHWRITPNGATQGAILEGPDAVAWLVPNEEDVAPLRREGANAFCAWGEFSSAHADRLRGYSGLVLVGVTLDDAGAWEAARRWRVLHPVVGPRRIQFRAGARGLWEGATLADHLAEGYGLAATRRVSLRDMREAIDRETERRRVQEASDGLLASIATRRPAITRFARTGSAS